MIARVAGIEIRIHITFILFLAWIGLSYYQIGGTPVAIQGLLFILGLFGCVLLHEFGHAVAARGFGIRTPDITLLPIGGVARLQRMPDKPWQELVVAIAGPLVNVIIAVVLILFLGRRADLGDVGRLQVPEIDMLAKLASVNVILVLFNLIPAFPMDGGRVLRALLAMMMNYARATQVAAWIGQGLAFVFGFIGLFTNNPILVFIALFVFLGAQQEAAMAQMKDVAHNLPISEAMETELVTLPENATLDDAVEALLRTSQHDFPVVDGDGHVLGVLTRDDMFRALKRDGSSAPVTSVMHRNLPAVAPDEPFDKAFSLMQDAASPALPVVDGRGNLLGLVTPENVGELMMVHSLRRRTGNGSGNVHYAWRNAPVAP